MSPGSPQRLTPAILRIQPTKEAERPVCLQGLINNSALLTQLDVFFAFVRVFGEDKDEMTA